MNMSKTLHWKILFGLWGFQGLVALVWLLTFPTDAENPLAFGFSSARLALVGIALLPTVLFAFFSIKYDALNKQAIWSRLKQNAVFWDIIYVVSFSTAFVVFCVIIVFNLLHNAPAYSAYAVRLYPLLLWLGLSGLEFVLFIGWNRYEQAKIILEMSRPIFRNAILLLGGLCPIGVFAAATGIGVTPDDNWGAPPVPFFEWQIILTLFIIGFAALCPRINLKISGKWMPVLVYLIALILWLSQPVNPAYTATPPRAPNFEIYPFSDPQFYAQYAQSALTGNGFLWPEVPARPFYVALLTWLHLLGNQNYNHVIILQSLILAFFPVLLYLLGKEIGGWPVGLGLSLLTIVRDINSNVVVDFTNNATYSKLFLSELPAALLISLATLLSLRWVRRANSLAWYPLLIGGVLGVATLIRLQSAVLALVVILLAFFIITDRKQWLKGTFLIVTGLALTITPWMARNYIAAGGFVLDNPISQTMTMTRRWSGNSGNDILPRLPNENDAQYSSRLTAMAMESLIQNPGFILMTTANHFINSEIASLLVFPMRDEILSPSELLWPQHAFWKTPLTIKQIPLFAGYLLLFTLGLSAAWRRLQLVGLLPLALGLAYNLWSALFFSSGARFIVPLDWSVHLYQFFGLLILCGILFSFTRSSQDRILSWLQPLFHAAPYASLSTLHGSRRFIAVLTLLLFLGGFTPGTEFIFPQKYPPKSQMEIVQRLGVTMRSGEIALYGRVIYPRYYEAGDGEPDTAKLGYGPAEQARLVFYLVGSNNRLVIFNLDSIPNFFPHTSDVYMIGTQVNGLFSPRVLMVTKDFQTEIYVASR